MKMLGNTGIWPCPYCANEQEYAEKSAGKRKGKQRRKKRLRAQEKQAWKEAI